MSISISQKASAGKLGQTAIARRQLLLLGGGIILIHFAFLKPAIWGLDGNEVLQVAHSLVTQHGFTVSPDVGGIEGIDGQRYSSRYLLLPILLTPLMAIAVGLSQQIGLSPLQIAATFAVASSVVFTAATAVMVVLLAHRLGSQPRAAYVAALCYAFGTIALTYAQTLFSEPLLGFLLVTTIFLAFGTTAKARLSSSLMVTLAILAKPTAVVVAPILSLYFLAKRYSSFQTMGPVILPILGAIAYGFYNFKRFGDPLDTGQPTHYALTAVGMWERFFGFFFSAGMGGGLVWYCPPVILALIGLYKLFKAKPIEAIAIALICVAFSGLHAFWWCCGWDWGPRFLVPLLPLMMSLSALLDYRARQWLIGLSILGFVINAPTLVSFYQRYYWEIDTAGRDVWSLSLWTPLANAPIFNVWGAAYRQVSEAISTDVSAVVATGELSGLTQIVPVWWWMLPAVGLPVWPGAVLAGGSAMAGIKLLHRGLLYCSENVPAQD